MEKTKDVEMAKDMEMTKDRQLEVIANKLTFMLNAINNNAQGKAILAKLRNSIGKPWSESMDIWQLIFENLPEEFLGTEQNLSKEEQAIFTTLQLYAVHQQGIATSVLMEVDEGYKNIGYSLKELRRGDNSASTDRRFNAMITASGFEELTYHLRHLLKLLKSRNSLIKINYGKLAKDLYWYSRGYEEKIRLAWAREYYRKADKGEKQNEQ